MRDAARIDKILRELEIIWKANPDLRLMQLLLNALGSNRFNITKDDYEAIDHYNTEDDTVYKELIRLYTGENSL